MPNVGEVRAKISGDASGFTSAAGSATAALGGLKGAFKGALAAGTAFAGASFFKSSVEEAARFESRMSDIATLLDGDVRGQIQGMTEEIDQMTRSLPVSPDELGASAYDVVSAGIEGTANQMDVLRESAKLATAGLGSTEQAVDLVTTALNSFNFDASEAGRVANVFFNTVDAGKNTVAELSDFFGQVAPLAKQAGISFEEVNAVTAVMTRRTGNAQKAQRGLRQILNAMMKPGEDLKELFNEMGVNSFPQLINRTGSFQEALQAVKDETQGNITEFANLVGSSRALSSALLSVGDAGDEVRQIQAEMRSDVTALERAVREQGDTFEAELQIMQNDFSKLQRRVGEDALPAMKDFVDFLGNDLIPRLERTGTGLNRVWQGFQLLNEGVGNLVGMDTRFEQQANRMAKLKEQASDTKISLSVLRDEIQQNNDVSEKQEKRIEAVRKAREQAIQELVEGARRSEEEVLEQGPISQDRLDRIRQRINEIKQAFVDDAREISTEVQGEFKPSALFGQIGGGIAEPFMQNIRSGIDDLKGEVAAMEGDFQKLFADVSREELAEKRFEEIREAVQSKFGQAMLEREDIQEAMAAGQWEQAAEQIKDEFDEFTQEMIDIGDRLAQAGLFGGMFGGDGGDERLPGAMHRPEPIKDMLKARERLRAVGEGGREGQMRETRLEQIAEQAKQGTKEGAKEGISVAERDRLREAGIRQAEGEGQFKANVRGQDVPIKAGSPEAARRRANAVRSGVNRLGKLRQQARSRSRFGIQGVERTGLASGGSRFGLQPQATQIGTTGARRQTRQAINQAAGQQIAGTQTARPSKLISATDRNTKATKQAMDESRKIMDRSTRELREVNGQLRNIQRRLQRLENQR